MNVSEFTYGSGIHLDNQQQKLYSKSSNEKTSAKASSNIINGGIS